MTGVVTAQRLSTCASPFAAWDFTRPQPVSPGCGELRKRPGAVSRLGDCLVWSIPGLAVAHQDRDFSRG
jgi:hypothetical protein